MKTPGHLQFSYLKEEETDSLKVLVGEGAASPLPSTSCFSPSRGGPTPRTSPLTPAWSGGRGPAASTTGTTARVRGTPAQRPRAATSGRRAGHHSRNASSMLTLLPCYGRRGNNLSRVSSSDAASARLKLRSQFKLPAIHSPTSGPDQTRLQLYWSL